MSFSPMSGDQAAGTYYTYICAIVKDYEETEECQLKAITVEEAEETCDADEHTITQSDGTYTYDAELGQSTTYTIPAWTITPASQAALCDDLEYFCKDYTILDVCDWTTITTLPTGGFTVTFTPRSGIEQTDYNYFTYFCAMVQGQPETEECQIKSINVEETDPVTCDADALTITPSESQAAFDAEIGETRAYTISAWTITPESQAELCDELMYYCKDYAS